MSRNGSRWTHLLLSPITRESFPLRALLAVRPRGVRRRGQYDDDHGRVVEGRRRAETADGVGGNKWLRPWQYVNRPKITFNLWACIYTFFYGGLHFDKNLKHVKFPVQSSLSAV